MVRIYLAGPMTNIPQFNIPTFMKAAKELREAGWEVFNPGEADVNQHGDFWKTLKTGSHEEAEPFGWSYKECLKLDLNWILDKAECIAFLPGWENSKGCRAEKALAECLGLEQIYL